MKNRFTPCLGEGRLRPWTADRPQHLHPGRGRYPRPRDQSKIQAQARLSRRPQNLVRGPAVQSGPHHRAVTYNVAPHPNDVWSHKQLLKIVSHTAGRRPKRSMRCWPAAIGWTDLVHQTPALRPKTLLVVEQQTSTGRPPIAAAVSTTSGRQPNILPPTRLAPRSSPRPVAGPGSRPTTC